MGNKRSGTNFPSAFRGKHGLQSERKNETAGEYNTSRYYRYNEALNINDQQPQNFRNDDQQYNDLNTEQYDDLNTGKYENFNGGGYYGSNYGSINQFNVGRDYEQNAGYRDNYNRLTTGQWPEIERATQSRRSINQQQRKEDNRGPHKGKGPRSYQRSDMRIREDIHDRLLEDPYIDATDIEVTVNNGEVTLSGTVDDRQAKRRAEDILDDISGIKHLENRLRARLPGGHVVNIKNSEQSGN
jgi:osmotically-inducible protein OsmY